MSTLCELCHIDDKKLLLQVQTDKRQWQLYNYAMKILWLNLPKVKTIIWDDSYASEKDNNVRRVRAANETSDFSVNFWKEIYKAGEK